MDGNKLKLYETGSPSSRETELETPNFKYWIRYIGLETPGLDTPNLTDRIRYIGLEILDLKH